MSEIYRGVPRIGRVVSTSLAVLLGIQTSSWADPKGGSQAQTSPAVDPGRSVRAVAAGSNPWVLCGSLSALSSCSLPSFPTDQYEYGFKYNTSEALVANCTFWNVGFRFTNRFPYFVLNDNPLDGTVRLGGAVFYTGTNASDDDVPVQCPAGFWRQQYWSIEANNVIRMSGSNGCYNLDIYCRSR